MLARSKSVFRLKKSTPLTNDIQDYQGRESRIIIISCVRSRERFVDDDIKKGMGLIHERKRYVLF
jgi:superfamily I DNA and/or RNA helicase